MRDTSTDRVVFFWTGGFFMATGVHDSETEFEEAYAEMVEQLGFPDFARVRAEGEGVTLAWYEGDQRFEKYIPDDTIF